MEEDRVSTDAPRQRGIQILDISNHLHTLIRVGYEAPISESASSKGRVQKRAKSKLRVISGKKSIMNEETSWRHWRSKMNGNDFHENRHQEEDNVVEYGNGTAARRRVTVGFSYGEMEVPSDGVVKSRHSKHSLSNLNVVSYNGVTMSHQQTPSMNNEMMHKRKFLEENYLKSDVRGTFKDYCDHCTIHGLKYVGDTSLTNFERAFWILSFVLAIFGAAYFIWLLYAKFMLSPIIISRSSESVSLQDFPFPAVTVCNMNNARKSYAKKVVNGNNTLEKVFLEDICDFKTTSNVQSEISDEAGEWDNVYQFLLNVSQNCSQMLYYCEWHGNETNCTDIFNPVLTDEGLCCNFNAVKRILYHPRTWKNLDITYASDTHLDWNPEYTFTNESANAIPWRAFSSGSNYGLTLALDVDADEYYCSSTASVGFKMLLHSPVETPQIADFAFTLSPGKETRVIITPHITDAQTSIMKISPKIRRCYFLKERKLRFYRTYTQRNCLQECEANFTLQHCNCMKYYMPVSNDTRICGKSDDGCALEARTFMKKKLYEDEDPLATSFNVTKVPNCRCYPGCFEINYSTEISQSMLMATFDIPVEYFKNNAEYFEKNIALVHIFFIDDSYMKYSKNQLYGFAELLSNTGGLLGLFMGFSLLSVIEIVYYFFIRIWWRIWRKKTNKNEKSRHAVRPFARTNDAVYPFAQ
ncbi:pickpocket protein 28-like [Nasonia vitripennis]|uniref:Pickpocket protein 28 n=1 Tax=Nasonia vitripennis TaxID=7425 RepID=A0A7M7LQY9_NASVI|nr:pickpocket protein 28-like [Nasonia vitripennis]